MGPVAGRKFVRRPAERGGGGGAAATLPASRLTRLSYILHAAEALRGRAKGTARRQPSWRAAGTTLGRRKRPSLCAADTRLMGYCAPAVLHQPAAGRLQPHPGSASELGGPRPHSRVVEVEYAQVSHGVAGRAVGASSLQAGLR
jgi:hypothetical protein